jgi:hypothetical protein
MLFISQDSLADVVAGLWATWPVDQNAVVGMGKRFIFFPKCPCQL